MPKREIKAPSVGESITEVRIGKWLKPEGSAVKAGEITQLSEILSMYHALQHANSRIPSRSASSITSSGKASTRL